MNNELSIVIRSMPGREHFLDKCLFTLSAQHYRELQVLVVVQTKERSEEADKLIGVLDSWRDRFADISAIAHCSDEDARAKSLNLGIKAARGRYIAFLDDDDKVYPEHYVRLICELQKSDYSWAYSDVVRAEYNELGQLTRRSMPFRRDRYSYISHLQENFIPIHSFVIDRERASDMPMVDDRFERLEDYDFLLRLARIHEPLYVPYVGAEYCIRNDGTNSVQDGTAQLRAALEKKRIWTLSRNLLEERQFGLVGWWVREIKDLPTSSGNRPPMTHHVSAVPVRYRPDAFHEDFYFRNALRSVHQSRSWRLTSGARNIIRKTRGMPKVVPHIPNTEWEAQEQVFAILNSSSWELTALLRLVPRLWRNRKKANRVDEQSASRS
ncbi:UNVERIFIED_ORG: glycosyltransferase involved in cell wall biosynthesis [Burkholderia sp. 1263]|jgi:glycosyltransferase involved in cell wall biosynthesis|uniref:glycosyltransferase family 2 protein n=1 Tax=Paraburkholderia terricola TaxID=169427 RepID=UPI002866F57C|nr:glycosyltransferase family 2 protein [Paraburkholderia terricola]MDR6450391.1 glycosyltransferase involved in cell wall biosynthesis [Paraburkholderia terricola]